MKVAQSNPTKIPGTNIETVWTCVTPELAKYFLVSNVENRAIRLKHIDRLAGDMAEDRFQITHQGLAFDENGKLIDGQHRCQAIIDSSQNQWLLVTTGLPEISKRVIDNGAKRAAHDFMTGKFKSIRSAGIRIMLAIEYQKGEFTCGQIQFALQQITAAAIQSSWADFDNAEQLSGMALEASRNVPTCGPAALFSAALCYPDTAYEFLLGLKTMTGLEQGDPRLALLRFRGGPKRIQSSTAAFVAIKAAKAFSMNKKINVLRVSSTEKLKI